MKLYKLTDGNDQSYGGYQWGENVTHKTTGWLYFCTHPLLAVMLNPRHENYELRRCLDDAHLWECEGEVLKSDHGLGVGCKKATSIKRIEIPEVTENQEIAFGILCSLEIKQWPEYVTWAKSWLNGKDRSEKGALAAARTCVYNCARDASIAFIYAYLAFTRGYDTQGDSYTIDFATAYVATDAVAIADKPIDLIKLAKRAMEEK